MNKPVSQSQLDRLITERGRDIGGPLALCGYRSNCWTPETTHDGTNPRNGRLTIRVAILDAPSKGRDDFVRITAEQWTSCANIEFKFVSSSEPSDIRIRFSNASWSCCGIDAKECKGMSMSLKYIDGKTIHNKRAVLHEFGHALGFEHEHSSPEARIKWDKAAVITKYQCKNCGIDEIERNFFRVVDKVAIRSPYDLESIMGYSISPELVTGGMVSTKTSTDLSLLDREWAQEFYPLPNCRERLDQHAMESRDDTEGLGPQVRRYQDPSIICRVKKLDDCFRESGMKVFRCSRPNCRPKNRQCDACLERHETFQDEGMGIIFQSGCWISSYVGSV